MFYMYPQNLQEFSNRNILTSRFGPISRKGITSMRNKPSQSQAIIDDQAHVSPVVSNSKQMSRPAPSLPTAFLQQTNGNRKF